MRSKANLSLEREAYLMKALVLTGPREFSYQDVETPVPGPGEARVRIRVCAVCGSDVHGIDGSTGRRRPPVIMGHEASGVIDMVGEGVKGWHTGERVTFDSTIYCGVCDMCRAGHVNLCADRRVLGVSCAEYRQDGAFAEYVCVPERILYRLPDAVSFLQASMVEPLSIACHAALRAPLKPGCDALVAGVGTIGMLTVQVLKSMGAGRVIAADIDEARLEMALRCGADAAVNSAKPDALRQIMDMTGGKGVDLAFDATGISATVNLCARAGALNAHIVLIGNVAPEVGFPLQIAVTRQQTYHGSCASAGEYPRCLEMIASGAIDAAALVSRVVPLSEGAEWINRVYDREPGLYKIALEVSR